MNNDLIIRGDLKKVIDKEFEKANLSDYEACSCVCEIYDKCIDNAPAVPLPDFKEGYKQAIRDGKTNFSRPQGKWILKATDYDAGGNIYECANCHYYVVHEKHEEVPFCWHCGAHMKGGVE